MKRFFIVAFGHSTGAGSSEVITYGGFINRAKFISDITISNHVIDVFITSIFEFKNEQDYLDFKQ